LFSLDRDSNHIKAIDELSVPIDVWARLNDEQAAAAVKPLDVLIEAAKDAFDPKRGARESPYQRISQNASLLFNDNFLDAALFIEHQHSIFV
jgi:hypothetical protein